MSGNKVEMQEVFDKGFYRVIMVDKVIRIKNKSSFAFTLERDYDKKEATLYFNTYETKSKNNFKVDQQSKFAKLYRLSTGKLEKHRYSKAQQLRRHFVGINFYCATSLQERVDGSSYFKVNEIAPVEPFYDDLWTKNGTLKAMPKKPKNCTLKAIPKTLAAQHELKNVVSTSVETQYLDRPSGQDPVVLVDYNTPESEAEFLEWRRAQES